MLDNLYIPISIIGHSGILCCYLESVWSFGFHFDCFLGWNKALFSLGVIIFCCRTRPLCVRYSQCPMCMRFSNLAGGSRHWSYFVCLLGPITSNPFGEVFPDLGWFSYTCARISAQSPDFIFNAKVCNTNLGGLWLALSKARCQWIGSPSPSMCNTGTWELVECRVVCLLPPGGDWTRGQSLKSQLHPWDFFWLRYVTYAPCAELFPVQISLPRRKSGLLWLNNLRSS